MAFWTLLSKIKEGIPWPLCEIPRTYLLFECSLCFATAVMYDSLLGDGHIAIPCRIGVLVARKKT